MGKRAAIVGVGAVGGYTSIPTGRLRAQWNPVRRREVLALLGWAGQAWPPVGFSEISSKTALLVVLTARPPDSMQRYIGAFDDGMRQAGYVTGRDYEITLRSTGRDATRAPALLAELIGLNPRAILTSDTPLTLAAKQATKEIPIIGVGIFNPVGFGLVQSIAHPGGNVTGLLSSVDRLVAKQLELLLQTVPGRTRIGILANVNNPANMAGVRFVQNDAALRSLRFVPAEIGQLSEIEPAFRSFVDNHVEAILVMQDALFNANARQVAALALAARTSDGDRIPRIRRGRRADELWARPDLSMAARRGVGGENH